jgi:hypothetical protein
VAREGLARNDLKGAKMQQALLKEDHSPMMPVDVGRRDFPLWLIGDANPSPGKTTPLTPTDARHRVWHLMWTPVLNVIDDRVYLSTRSRVDSHGIHVRNALSDLALKPEPSQTHWSPVVEDALLGLRKLISAHRPTLLISFGAFAFEFVRRAIGERDLHPHGFWAAKRLGDQFRQRIANFEPGAANVIPLLHRRLSTSKYMESHEYFCGQVGVNYFEVVGEALADTMLRYRDQLPVWIE